MRHGRAAILVVACLALAACGTATSTPLASVVGQTAGASGATFVVVTPPPSLLPPATAANTPAAPPTLPPSPTETPSPTPVETATVPPTATPTSNGGGGTVGLVVHWKPAANSGVGAASDFEEVASRDGVLVAVGRGGENDDPYIWTSSDGSTWSVATWTANPEENIWFSAVTATHSGFVVVGTDSQAPNGVAYLSTDGTNWERVDSDAFIGRYLDRVSTSGSNYVVFTEAAGGQEASVITSADGGHSWQVADTPSASHVASGLLDVTQDGTSIWALAGEMTGTSRASLELWRSNDGTTWELVGDIRGTDDAERAWLAQGPGGFSVIASRYHHNTSIWSAFQSADGVSWQPAAQNPTDVTDLVATYAGFVAAGHYNLGQGCALDETQDVGVTWTSVDGIIWRQMSEKGWKGREIQVVGLSGQTLAGLGVDLTQDFGQGGSLWTAGLPKPPQDLAPSPSPTPAPTPIAGCGD